MGSILQIPKKINQQGNLKASLLLECITKNLKVMDMTAFTLCMENQLPIIVFDMNTPGTLLRVVTGEKVGTLVSG